MTTTQRFKPWQLASIARMALVCALLVASLMGLGCTTVDKWNRESDELLDKLNDPSPVSSGSASGSSESGSGSGLAVVERKAMPVQTVRDTKGRSVKLWGQASSTSKTPGHDDMIAAKAVDMASSGKYEYVLMQRSWRTATGREASSTRIPDIIGVRRDGKVDAVEIQSTSDEEDDLMKRLEEGMNTLPPERRGDTMVLSPQ